MSDENNSTHYTLQFDPPTTCISHNIKLQYLRSHIKIIMTLASLAKD